MKLEPGMILDILAVVILLPVQVRLAKVLPVREALVAKVVDPLAKLL